MRERTTWNRQEIAKAASQGRTAEDPRAMNQDHLQQQPAADAYVTGGPSEFAEDVHPPEGTWKAEYAGGETKRNEIGMPEFRSDTFKTAGLDEETLTKKAEVCIKVARAMLPRATEASVEDQAYALMHLPDVELIETATRLAKGQVPPEFLEQQKKKGEGDEDEDEGEKKEAAQQKQQGQQQKQQGQQQKQQGQQQDMDEADEEDATQQQQKQAFSLAEQVVQSIQSGQQQQAQQQIQQMVQQAMQQQQGTGTAYTIGQQVQEMIQQAMQQQQAQQQVQQGQQQVQQGQQQVQQGQQQVQQGVGPAMSDDQMLDQMLQQEMEQDQQMMQGEPMDIQLEGAPMDIGEVQLGPEDAVLGQLFASNQEVMEAQQAEALRTGIPIQAQAPVTVAGTTRTASTRTVGTRPTGGVSQLGGAAAASTPSADNEIDKLSSMWRSAPDMSGVFNGE